MNSKPKLAEQPRAGERVGTLARHIAAAVSIATGLLGAGISVIPDVVVDIESRPACLPWYRGINVGRTATMCLLLTLGIVALWRARALFIERERMLNSRGSVYVLQSSLAAWRSDGWRKKTISDLHRHYARVFEVASPGQLCSEWNWETQMPGAHYWSQGVHDLVAAFRANVATDDPTTPYNVALWVPWSVALGWRARVSSAEVLNVGVIQRDSIGGRVGAVFANYDADPLFFMPEEVAPAADVCIEEIRRKVRLILGPNSAFQTPRSQEVRVLLLQATGTNWGPIDAASRSDEVLDLKFSPCQDLGIEDGQVVELLEWRCSPRNGRRHEWRNYSSVASRAAAWVARNGVTGEGVNLLGCNMMMEASAGIGAYALREKAWPKNLWPLNQSSGESLMTIPGLNLGRDSLRQRPLSPGIFSTESHD